MRTGRQGEHREIDDGQFGQGKSPVHTEAKEEQPDAEHQDGRRLRAVPFGSEAAGLDASGHRSPVRSHASTWIVISTKSRGSNGR